MYQGTTALGWGRGEIFDLAHAYIDDVVVRHTHEIELNSKIVLKNLTESPLMLIAIPVGWGLVSSSRLGKKWTMVGGFGHSCGGF